MLQNRVFIFVSLKFFYHCFRLLKRNFLCVPSVADLLCLTVFHCDNYVLVFFKRHILNKQPLHLKNAAPLPVLSPVLKIFLIITRAPHPRESDVSAAAIAAEEQEDAAPVLLRVSEGVAQREVPGFGRGPDAVFDRFVHVLFCEGFNNKEL